MRRMLLAACALLLAACTTPADLREALEVTDVSTGWYDAGVVDGKNKLVPSVTFRVQNRSDANVSSVPFNVVFRFVDSGEEQDNIFLQRVDFSEKTTAPLTVRSQNGYTGEPPQSRADMLKNSHFRDLEVTILVRQSASQWHELYRGPVARELITQ